METVCSLLERLEEYDYLAGDQKRPIVVQVMKGASPMLLYQGALCWYPQKALLEIKGVIGIAEVAGYIYAGYGDQ